MEPKRVKYPRTPHLPWSPGRTSDDVLIESLSALRAQTEVVVTEKLDGENTTLYRDRLHARSIDSSAHESRDWVKALHARVRHQIPSSMRVCGENVFAVHSIEYDALPSFFLAFGIYVDEQCIAWDDTVKWAAKLGLSHVPVLYRGPWTDAAIQACWQGVSAFGPEQEGYVVRAVGDFAMADFGSRVAKYVRPCHVTSEKHWKAGPVRRNRLAR